MDEFKPEDELKPDTSDRRPQRSRKTSSTPKVPVSRQHMMMGIGILVLLLLVIGIGSALNSPGDSGQSVQKPASPPGKADTSPSGNDKNIDLSGSASMSGSSGAASEPPVDSPPAMTGEPQEISAPPISSTPTQAAPVETPANQQRVELPGDLNNALSNQQGQVDAAAQGAQGSSGTFPTAPATVAPGGKASASGALPRAMEPPHRAAPHRNQPAAHKAAPAKPAAVASKSKSSSSTSATHGSPASAKASSAAPGGSYTLQLSSASRSDTLNAWAKKQNLNGYHVYKTTRNGQPWYVLVSGAYATSAEAKRAVASLPAEVRAQNPWVKPVSQVKKESAD